MSCVERESVEECLLLVGDSVDEIVLFGRPGRDLFANDATGMRAFAAWRWTSDSLNRVTFEGEDLGRTRAFCSRHRER